MQTKGVFKFTEEMQRGQFPVNVPTSLALESLMNIHPELKHPTAPHKRFKQYYLNIATLYRNITTSFTAHTASLLNAQVLAELLNDEWQAIVRVLADTDLTPVLYRCDYTQVAERFKEHTDFRTLTAPKQIDDRKRMLETFDIFFRDNDYVEQYGIEIQPQSKGPTAIQTHLALDLLSHQNFDELELLESHTGVFKNQSLWYTKLVNGKELSTIPFNHYFMRIFGDKEFFKPMTAPLRKAIVDLSLKYEWSAITTDGRVKINIGQLEDREHERIVKEMMKQ